LYGLAYDRVRHRLYATAWNAHLYVFDIATRRTTDAGRVTNWDVCRTIVADDQGNCYGTSDKHQMFKYDGTSGRLFDLPIIPGPNPPVKSSFLRSSARRSFAAVTTSPIRRSR
jgi:hypothetical protein